MSKFTVTHEINCDVATFWKLFFDDAFNNELYLKVLGFPSFKVLSHVENDREIVRRVTGQPKVDLPGPVAKLLGSNFSYTEDGRFDKARGVWTWKMTPSTLADKVKQEGVLRLESIGSARVRRIADLFVEAKVFGLGGLIESSTEKQLRQGWNDSAVFENKYIAEKGL